MISIKRANASLGYEFGKRSFTPADTYILRLTMTEVINGTGYTEPDISTGYVPLSIPNNAETWSVPANRVVSNAIPFLFENFTASLPYDKQIIGWFITESNESNADAIYYGEFDESRPILKDSQIWIRTGEMKLERTDLS